MVLFTALAIFGAGAAAQASSENHPAPANTTQPQNYPAPTNLKVLPKGTTGKQLHNIMEGWTTSLGVECGACHTDDPDHRGPDGRPSLKFADDSKQMKKVARDMYTMTEEINATHIAKLEGSGAPVTCGTCHRGHIGPEPFDPASLRTKCPPAMPSMNEHQPAAQ